MSFSSATLCPKAKARCLPHQVCCPCGQKGHQLPPQAHYSGTRAGLRVAWGLSYMGQAEKANSSLILGQTELLPGATPGV